MLPTHPPGSWQKNRILILDSVDPYWNLAYETHLLEQRRKLEGPGRWLLLWRNEPSVILGRNQNPWVECDIPWLRKQNINLVRRESGGGTVYHDLGNTCVSVLTEKHEPERNLQFACETLQKSFNLSAYLGPRKDIFLDGFKVSGSAFRITNKASYHHFTLLLATELTNLEASLQPTHTDLVSKATASVRSKVLNLSSRAAIDHTSLCAALSSHFQTYFASSDSSAVPIERIDLSAMKATPEVQTVHKQITSWDYIFGRTPEFTHTLKSSFNGFTIELAISVVHGIISSVTADSSPNDFVLENALRLGLVGHPYHRSTLSQTLLGQEAFIADPDSQDRFQEVRLWLESCIHS